MTLNIDRGPVYTCRDLHVNGVPVTNATPKCQVLTTLAECDPEHSCAMWGGRAVCNVTKTMKLPFDQMGPTVGFDSFLTMSLVVVVVMAGLVAISVRMVTVALGKEPGFPAPEESAAE
ncbi:hypothetical protein ElyMa_000217200 [Elysia marginata]|uniref:Uncharacterized protein n=1 Tax=Elysia marginata TaxID=1093978 RepID=A0AAV4EZ30_9GAST|nr:hypothetical protein ElyMa_000217200 [Elysia marginata]